jgi:hypothetical protein
MSGVRKTLVRRDLETRVALASHKSPRWPSCEMHAALKIAAFGRKKGDGSTCSAASEEKYKSKRGERWQAVEVWFSKAEEQLNNRIIEVQS